MHIERHSAVTISAGAAERPTGLGATLDPRCATRATDRAAGVVPAPDADFGTGPACLPADDSSSDLTKIYYHEQTERMHLVSGTMNGFTPPDLGDRSHE